MSTDLGLKQAVAGMGPVKPTEVVAEVLRARARGECALLNERNRLGNQKTCFEQAGSEGLE